MTYIVSWNLLVNYVSFVVAFSVFIPEICADSTVSYESFCNANPPTEIDHTEAGRGKFIHNTVKSKESWIINLNKGEDDGINIMVSSFNLKNSFLVIRKVPKAGVQSSGKIQFLSGEVAENLQFFIPYSKSFYMEICPEEESKGEGSFTINYERAVPDFGEGPLPSEPPEVEKKRQAVEIQFKGKTPNEFRDEVFILMFKEALKSIAHDYCLKTKISFDNRKSADEMVTIHGIHKCPLEWSDTNICTSIYHSIFVSGGDGSERRIWEYELTKTHLQDMWISAVDKHLKPIGLSKYEPPNKAAAVGWWFLIIVLPFLLVIGFVFLLRAQYMYIIDNMRNSSSTTADATDVEKRRKSKLKPNKYQDIPLFLKEQTMDGNGGKEVGRAQAKHRSYRAALLLSRFNMKETIPE